MTQSRRVAARSAHRMLVISLCALPALALAQAPGSGWKPDKPVELVVGAAPGGANDRIGRSLQRLLQDSRGGTINVVNKPGGGQMVAFAYLNTHPANPHYLGLASSSWLTTVAAGRGTVTHRDFTPVVKLLDEYQVYFVKADSPIATGRDIAERLQSEALKKDLVINFWTIDLVGHRELPAFLEQEHQNYRRALTALGMVK